MTRLAWLAMAVPLLGACADGDDKAPVATPRPSAAQPHSLNPPAAGACYELAFQALPNVDGKELAYLLPPSRIALIGEPAADQRQGPWFQLRHNGAREAWDDSAGGWQSNDVGGFEWFWSNGFSGSRGSFHGSGRVLTGSAHTFSDAAGSEYSLSGEARTIPCGPWTGTSLSEPERRPTKR